MVGLLCHRLCVTTRRHNAVLCSLKALGYGTAVAESYYDTGDDCQLYLWYLDVD